MARYASFAVYSSAVGKGIVFAETATGYWGYQNDTNTSQRCDCTSNTLRAAMVPTQAGYYCNGWTSSGYTEDADTQSLISFTSNKSAVVQGKIGGGSSLSGPKVTVIDAHGTHIGTPTGTDMHFKASHVVGVWHTSTASGYVFTGWKVTKSSTASNAGTLLSDGGTTSGKVTTFPADYNYAVVFKTGSSGSYSVTIEAVYQQQLTVSYNANGGSPTPASQTAAQGETITLASAITRSGYNFGGWSIDGLTYAAGANYTVSASVTAVAIWTQEVTYLVDFDKNNPDATGSAIPSVSVTAGNSTILPYPDGWSLAKHVFGYWCETADGTGAAHGAGENFTPTASVRLYAIWTQSEGEGAANDWYSTDYVGSTRHSFYQYYYHLLVSTNLPQQIQFLVPTTLEGFGQTITPSGQTTTYTRSAVVNTTVTAPADDPTSQYANASHFYYTNAGTNPRQCDGWADYYIPTSDGNYTSLFNYPIGDWTWTAPEVTNYDFVGWYTIGRSYHASSGDTYQVPNLKSDFTMCVSKERTITWQLLEDALNYWGYLYYFQKLADYRYRSESRSYNFLRLVYKLKTKTITFMANGGSGAMPLQQIPVTGGQLNANQFTRTNHVFLGWALSASGSVVYADGATIVPTQDLTLYAKWSSLERVVTFHPNGGEASQYFKRVVQGQTYGTLPTCTYEGRTFLGWFTQLSGGTQVTSSTVVSALDEHTLYAHWSNATVAHTLTFNPCEGSVSPATRQVNEGSAYGTLPVPTRSGYSFAGWFTGTVAGSQVTASTVMGDDDAIVYARWSASLVTVTFNPNGGSVAEVTRSVKYGSQIGTLPQPHRDGMNFDGWHTAASGGVVVEATRIVTSAFTCYAHWSNGTATWTNVRYRIQLVTNGGTVASSYGELKYTKGKAKALPTSSQVTRSGYSFAGWYKKADFSGSVQTSIPATASGTVCLYARWS